MQLKESKLLNKYTLSAQVWGPKDTCYQNGLFHLELEVNLNCKPNRITQIMVKNKIWHPNIHCETGEICEDFLATEDWEAGLNIRQALL